MIQITVHGELITRLDQIPVKMRAAVGMKFRELMEEVYHKAVLQFSAGKYATTPEVGHGVDEQGSALIGWLEPLTTKARVQEYGGKRWYEIYPSKAKVLRFLGRDGTIVYSKYVWHPPAQAKHYITNTLIEMKPIIQAELAAAARGVPK